MNYKILMVDDDRELLKMLNQYFTLKNYTVIIAENGIEAMEKISVNPDIILLDVNMPGMDGIEVCRRIRDMVSCPIIFLTAKVEEQDRVMGCFTTSCTLFALNICGEKVCIILAFYKTYKPAIYILPVHSSGSGFSINSPFSEAVRWMEFLTA